MCKVPAQGQTKLSILLVGGVFSFRKDQEKGCKAEMSGNVWKCLEILQVCYRFVKGLLGFLMHKEKNKTQIKMYYLKITTTTS